MYNLFTQLQELNREDPVQVGTVVALTDAGCVVEVPGGGRVNVTGTASLTSTVYFKSGAITGVATTLPIFLIDV